MNRNADIKKIEELTSNWEPWITEIDKLTEAITSEILVDAADIQGVFIVALFQKLLSNCNASIELISSGYIYESKMIIRSCLEIQFLLRSIHKDDRNLMRVLRHNEKIRSKWFNIVENRKHLSPLKEIIDELKMEKPLKENCEEVGVEAWAQAAGMQEIYDWAYRSLSNEAHSNLLSILEEIERDKNGAIVAFCIEPDYRQINKLKFTALLTLLYGLIDIDERILKNNKDKIVYCHNRVVEWATSPHNNGSAASPTHTPSPRR